MRKTLEAVVTADVERHHKAAPLLSDKPAKVADRLRAAGAELAAQDAMNQAFRWFTAKLVDEVTEGLRDRGDDIAAMLRSTFADALTAVTEAADAGSGRRTRRRRRRGMRSPMRSDSCRSR